MSRTAYVTGSTGFLGLNVVEVLKEQGWEVIALRRKTSNTRDLDAMGVKQVEGDVTNLESLRATMPVNVDAVFHVAADTGLWKKLNDRQNCINIQGTRNVVQVALEKSAKRLIHTSSIGAFGNIYGQEIREDIASRALESPINYYRSKYYAEQEVLNGIERGLDAVIMNPAQIVGPYDYNYTPQMFSAVKSGLMVAVPQGSSVMGHVRDYALAHEAAFEKGRTGERYLLGGVHATFRELFMTMGRVIGKETNPRFLLPPWLITVSADLLDRLSLLTNREPLLSPEKAALLNHPIKISSAKAERELGFTTCSLDKMLDDSYRWMRKAGIM